MAITTEFNGNPHYVTSEFFLKPFIAVTGTWN